MTVVEAADSCMRFNGPVFDSSLVTCPWCHGVASLTDWTETDGVDCDSCGWHYGVKCPGCSGALDPVMDESLVWNVVAS